MVFSPMTLTCLHTHARTHTQLDWRWQQMSQAIQQVFSNANSLPSIITHTTALRAAGGRVGGAAKIKINPIFCSFLVQGCNPLLPPLILHRWGIRLASGSALSRGEGDGQGRDRAGRGWKCSVTGLRITATIGPDTLSHLPWLKLFHACGRQTDRYRVSACDRVYLCLRRRPKLGVQWGAGCQANDVDVTGRRWRQGSPV